MLWKSNSKFCCKVKDWNHFCFKEVAEIALVTCCMTQEFSAISENMCDFNPQFNLAHGITSTHYQ